MKFRIVIGIVIIVPVLFIGWFVYRMNSPNVGLNVSAFYKAPCGDSEISYIDAPLFGQAVFKISESDFNLWINEISKNTRLVVKRDEIEYVYGRVKGIDLERYAQEKCDSYSWHDTDGGGLMIRYYREMKFVIYNWSSN